MAAVYFDKPYLLLDSGSHKDPTKYWYVEKYVYGTLTETVEIALGTSAAFGSVVSGYDDDTFYGWSISPTSTTRTFNNTTKYSNTTTAVKNNLDGENTLKIYAVYSYTVTTTGQKTISAGGGQSGSFTTLAGTMNVKGYSTSSSGAGSLSLSSGNANTYVRRGAGTQVSPYVYVTGTVTTTSAGINTTVSANQTWSYKTASGTSNTYLTISYPTTVTTTKYRVTAHIA